MVGIVSKPDQPHGCGCKKFWLPKASEYSGPVGWLCYDCHPPGTWQTPAEVWEIENELKADSSELKTGKPKFALSIKQPWAYLICAGYKDIENRDWRIGRKVGLGGVYQNRELTLPQRVYVHAGKQPDKEAGLALSNYQLDPLTVEQQVSICSKGQILGAIIGEVDITGCVTESTSPWFVGKYGFTLEKPTLYKQPIPYPGQLGFFEVKL